MINWKIKWLMYFLASFTFLGFLVAIKGDSLYNLLFWLTMHIVILGQIAYAEKIGISTE